MDFEKVLEQAIEQMKQDFRERAIASAAHDWGTTEEKARKAFDFFDDQREKAESRALFQGIQIGADVALEGFRGAIKQDKRVLELLLSDTELIAQIKETDEGDGFIFALGIDGSTLDEAKRAELKQMEREMIPQESKGNLRSISDFLQ